MSERFPDEVLREAILAFHEAQYAQPPGYAAMRAVLEGHLGKACTDNPLQNELLDLITLMPDFQTQEIIDYIMSLREIMQKHVNTKTDT